MLDGIARVELAVQDLEASRSLYGGQRYDAGWNRCLSVRRGSLDPRTASGSRSVIRQLSAGLPLRALVGTLEQIRHAAGGILEEGE
jgi:hypothetical protein